MHVHLYIRLDFPQKKTTCVFFLLINELNDNEKEKKKNFSPGIKKKEKKTKRYKKKDGIMTSVTQYQHIGSRDYQEDRMVVIPGFARLPHFTLCLVCDGHGGDATSDFLIEEFPKQLHMAFDQYRKSKKKAKQSGEEMKEKENVTTNLMGIALERCIELWDEKCFGNAARKFKDPEMRHIFGNDERRAEFFNKHCDEKEWKQKGLRAGSTLNCMIIDFQKCRAHILNIGDSRTTWIVDDTTIGQTIDHTVKRKLEKTRGVTCDVVDGRLEGILAMSHAVGDNDEPLLGKVKRDYQTTVVDFKGKTFRAVTATDGLFDVRTNHQLLYDTFDDADDIARSALQSIAENEEFKRAEMVDAGLMSAEASATPYKPAFVDNVSIIYVKIPRNHAFVPKADLDDVDDIAQRMRRMSAPRKLSLKKSSLKKKEVVFLPRHEKPITGNR